MAKILITGGSGFVGRHFIKLLNRDHDLVIVDIKECTAPGKYLFYKQDCRDFFDTHHEEYDLIIHLAAIVGGRLNIEGNPIAVATDLSIDAEMFNWAVNTQQPRVVYFSSSAAYPIEYQTEHNHSKLKEEDINLKDVRNPDMTYGWSKLTGEILAEHARSKRVKVYVFRPFSGYGVDQDLDYPFPSFIKRVKDKVPEFEIWGKGTQVRDFIHIDDVCEAVMACVDQDIKEPINLGTGVATSFIDLANKCMEISGHRVPIKTDETKPIGVFYRVADTENMLKYYKPKISLEEGIKQCLM